MKHNRSRAVIIGAIAAIGVLVSIAVVSASHAPGQIVLTIEDNTNEFVYGGTTQSIEVGRADCSITDDSRTGEISDGEPVIVMTASTYDKAGRLVDGDAPIGVVEDGLGVNLRGKGNGQDCGRVDHLGGVDANGDPLSERLKFELGSAVEGQMLSSVEFDLEAKYEPTIHFWFWRNGVVIDDYSEAIGDGSDSGPDSKFRDKYSVTASTSEGLFDAIEISMDSGGVSVEGGATWKYSDVPGDEPDSRRTFFNLEDVVASASISDTTSGDVNGNIAANESFIWEWTVMNTGDLDLGGLSVDVSVNGASAVAASCSSADVTSPGSTTCTLEIEEPPAGDIDLGASLTATSEYGGEVTATTSSSYFGVDSGMAVDARTNGVDGGPEVLFIPVGDPVTWTYIVTNTGNAELSGVSVLDDQGVAVGSPSGDTDIDGKLDAGETWIYTAPVGTAIAGPYTNTATASAIDVLGSSVQATPDSSGHFGSAPGVEIRATLVDDTVLPTELVMWDITVDNTGNVALTFVVVTEDGDEVCDLGTILPGGDATCDYDHPPTFGYNETTFKVEASAPPGVLVDETSDTYDYVGTLACDDAYEEGEPGISDTPLVSFSAGPNTKEQECEVPLNLLSSVDPGTGVQTVTVAPPSGYSWDGVSGLVTIQWDGETVSADPIARTVLGTNPSTDPVIPWCNAIVGVARAQSGGIDLWYYELSPASGVYLNAVTYGLPSDPVETCLVLQSTETVLDGVEIKTQTTEVFYIYNDPIFSR